MMPYTEVLEWLREQGLQFRLPELLWALGILPMLLLFYVGVRRSRRHVSRAFRVAGYRPKRSARGMVRALALVTTWLGLAAAIVGFARPVIELPVTEDQATLVIVIDASMAMRATDVRPTRIEAAVNAARLAIENAPRRAQVAVVAYSESAYILLPPTRDHGAAPAVLRRLRTADGAALGDALLVGLAAIPAERGRGGGQAQQQPGGQAQAGPPGHGAGTGRVPSAIVLISSGDVTAGREVGEAVAALAEARVQVHTLGIGPRQGQELRAPYDEQLLRQISRATGGRHVPLSSQREWRDTLGGLGSSTIEEVRPQEIGHYVGAGGLMVIGLGMLLSLLATHRLV